MIYGTSARLPAEEGTAAEPAPVADAAVTAKRRSVAARVLASYVLVMMAFAITAAFSIDSQRRAAQDAKLLNSGYVPLKSSIERVLEAQTVMGLQLNHITELKNPSEAKVWIETLRRLRPRSFADIRTVAQSLGAMGDARARTASAELVRQANEIEKYLQADVERVARLFAALDSGDPERADSMQNDLISYETEGGGRLRELLGRVDREMDDLVNAAQSRERRSIIVLLTLSVLTLAVGVLVSLHTRRVLRPLALVTDRAKAVAQGDLTPRSVVASADEIGELAETFEKMVTAIARANADLVQAERLAGIGKMAAHVTHEIRNPLSSMGLNIELLEEELAASPERTEARQLVRAVKREVERLAELSNEYLRMARRPSPNLERERIGDVVREVVEFTLPELSKARITCDVEIEEGLPAVAFDQGQIRQALLNLIRNAREALQPSGGALRLSVRAARERGGIDLVVDDDGAGIPQEIIGKIFDPFFTTKERGTGLGLALTRQIVEAHGGSIVCEPRAPRGTRFSIHLPPL